jgi:hypothetical protein
MHAKSLLRAGAALAVLALPALAGAQATGVTPGQWEIAVTVTAVEAPSLPSALTRMMTGQTVTARHCLTPEEAQRGPQDMLKADKSCVFNSYSMAGGRLAADMTCGDTHAVSAGSFTAEAFTAAATAEMAGKTPMKMSSTIAGRRVGACAP